MRRGPAGQPTSADHTLIKCTVVRVNQTKATNLPRALTYVNPALDASLAHAQQLRVQRWRSLRVRIFLSFLELISSCNGLSLALFVNRNKLKTWTTNNSGFSFKHCFCAGCFDQHKVHRVKTKPPESIPAPPLHAADQNSLMGETITSPRTPTGSVSKCYWRTNL